MGAGEMGRRRARERDQAAGETQGVWRRAVRDYESGNLAAAEAGCRRLLESRPKHAQALHLAALIAQRGGDGAACAALAAKASAADPAHPTYHNTLGTALYDGGRPAEAIASFRRALALDANFAEAHINLGNAFYDMGKLDAAVESFRRAVTCQPDQAAWHANLGHALLDSGAVEDAVAALSEAVARDPTLAQAHNLLGDARRTQGDFEAAKAAYWRAIEIDPRYVEPYCASLELEPAAADDERIAILEALRGDENLALSEAIQLQFALGRIYAALGRHDDAFAAYRTGNALRNRRAADLGQRFDVVGHRRRVDRLTAAFTAPFFVERREYGVASELPVVIVGVPRSGTSLVEQIVASHPAVHGAGELPELGKMATGTGTPFPDWLEWLDADAARSLAERYLRRLRALSPAASRITDKMPGNFFFLGLLAVILPQARVIHCRRDPLDNCVSCYFHNFTHRHIFSNDLENLGAYYRAYQRLMCHWRETLPLAMLEVDYEALITNQEKTSREIIAFLGLNWDPGCLSFERNPRAVTTASNVQVRRGLFTTSVGRWRAYEKHLGPLKKALEDGP